MKFDYNDQVVRLVDGQEGERVGVVVAFTEIQHEDQVQRYGQPIGTTLCTIEFGDGKEELSPESEIRPYRAEA